MRRTLIGGLILASTLCLAAGPQGPEPTKEAAVHLTPGAVARPGLLEDVLKADAALFKAFFDDVTPADVRWICGRLSRISDQQWSDAFRAGGYAEPTAQRYIRRLKQKIAEGLELGS